MNGYIGKPLRRREDARFIQGHGRYVDDIHLPGMAWCAFVRSPHAHARIRSIAAQDTAALPGVLLVLTAADWIKAGLGELEVVHPMPFGDGRPMNEAPRPAFACERVRHVGDVVAAVIAEDRAAALDAAEAVDVDYEVLPAVTELAAAVAPGAPLVHERFGSNLVFEIEGEQARPRRRWRGRRRSSSSSSSTTAFAESARAASRSRALDAADDRYTLCLQPEPASCGGGLPRTRCTSRSTTSA